MGERRLERIPGISSGLFFYDYALEGFSLRFVSGPEATKDIKPGSWLDMWQIIEGKRRFSFGPQKTVAFTTKEAAIDAKAELVKAVDIITEVVE